MKTEFTPAQLANPDIAQADTILRKCVHCGFCTATCPTYVLLGDELDSPRGRIYLIKEMLEKEEKPTQNVVKHVDRCLSCLACMTTCPSGVHYMHLVDHARDHIERTYTRPLGDRLLRAILAWVLPHNSRFRRALGAARLGKPFARLFAALGLTVGFGDLHGVVPEALVIFALLTFVIRPVVSVAALVPERLTQGERSFVAWGGLKGAVPILLASFAILGGARDSERIYDIVFVAVLASILVQGTTLPLLARRVGIVRTDR